MDWPQAVFMVISFVGVVWAMHRENAKETKEFHGRLCALEEKYVQMMQRVLERKGK